MEPRLRLASAPQGETWFRDRVTRAVQICGALDPATAAFSFGLRRFHYYPRIAARILLLRISMNVLLLAPELEASDRWFHGITVAAPGTKIVRDRELPDDEIAVAIVDTPSPGRLCQIPNLKLIMSLSAGIDAMMLDPTLPDVPIVRLVPPEMIALMREYVCYQVLRIHRNFAAIEQLHREMRWEWLSAAKPAMDRRVLVLGLGDLGRRTAEALNNLGFQVSGWSCR